MTSVLMLHRGWCCTVLLVSALILSSCANVIREEPAVIWDRIEGTDDLKVQNLDFDGALARLNLTYVCERRQFAVTNIYQTNYNPGHEVYEVPVGLVTLPFSFLWYLGSSLVSLGSASPEITRGPVYWSAAGLNPLMPVENGMFVERYSIEEKGGSRRPQEGSKSDPYDAPVHVEKGRLELRFIEPNGRRSDWQHLNVGEELMIEVNLLEAAVAIPSAQTQKVELRARVKPSSELRLTRKEVTFFLPPELSQKLFEAKAVMAREPQKQSKAKRNAAMQELTAMGLGREAAMVFQRR